jgi:hypothetical protein
VHYGTLVNPATFNLAEDLHDIQTLSCCLPGHCTSLTYLQMEWKGRRCHLTEEDGTRLSGHHECRDENIAAIIGQL